MMNSIPMNQIQAPQGTEKKLAIIFFPQLQMPEDSQPFMKVMIEVPQDPRLSYSEAQIRGAILNLEIAQNFNWTNDDIQFVFVDGRLDLVGYILIISQQSNAENNFMEQENANLNNWYQKIFGIPSPKTYCGPIFMIKARINKTTGFFELQNPFDFEKAIKTLKNTGKFGVPINFASSSVSSPSFPVNVAPPPVLSVKKPIGGQEIENKQQIMNNFGQLPSNFEQNPQNLSKLLSSVANAISNLNQNGVFDPNNNKNNDFNPFDTNDQQQQQPYQQQQQQPYNGSNSYRGKQMSNLNPSRRNYSGRNFNQRPPNSRTNTRSSRRRSPFPIQDYKMEQEDRALGEMYFTKIQKSFQNLFQMLEQRPRPLTLTDQDILTFDKIYSKGFEDIQQFKRRRRHLLTIWKTDLKNLPPKYLHSKIPHISEVIKVPSDAPDELVVTFLNLLGDDFHPMEILNAKNFVIIFHHKNFDLYYVDTYASAPRASRTSVYDKIASHIFEGTNIRSHGLFRRLIGITRPQEWDLQIIPILEQFPNLILIKRQFIEQYGCLYPNGLNQETEFRPTMYTNDNLSPTSPLSPRSSSSSHSTNSSSTTNSSPLRPNQNTKEQISSSEMQKSSNPEGGAHFDVDTVPSLAASMFHSFADIEKPKIQGFPFQKIANKSSNEQQKKRIVLEDDNNDNLNRIQSFENTNPWEIEEKPADENEELEKFLKEKELEELRQQELENASFSEEQKLRFAKIEEEFDRIDELSMNSDNPDNFSQISDFRSRIFKEFTQNFDFLKSILENNRKNLTNDVLRTMKTKFSEGYEKKSVLRRRSAILFDFWMAELYNISKSFDKNQDNLIENSLSDEASFKFLENFPQLTNHKLNFKFPSIGIAIHSNFEQNLMKFFNSENLVLKKWIFITKNKKTDLKFVGEADNLQNLKNFILDHISNGFFHEDNNNNNNTLRQNEVFEMFLTISSPSDWDLSIIPFFEKQTNFPETEEFLESLKSCFIVLNKSLFPFGLNKEKLQFSDLSVLEKLFL